MINQYGPDDPNSPYWGCCKCAMRNSKPRTECLDCEHSKCKKCGDNRNKGRPRI